MSFHSTIMAKSDSAKPLGQEWGVASDSWHVAAAAIVGIVMFVGAFVLMRYCGAITPLKLHKGLV